MVILLYDVVFTECLLKQWHKDDAELIVFTVSSLWCGIIIFWFVFFWIYFNMILPMALYPDIVENNWNKIQYDKVIIEYPTVDTVNK